MSPSRTLQPSESAGIGALSGIIEVGIAQPSIYIKNSIQNQTPILLRPRVLYRGVLVNAASVAPIYAMQFSLHGLLERRLDIPEGGQIPVGQRIANAASAGAVSALIAGPAELLMTQQQKTGFALLNQVIKLKNENGLLSFSRGMLPTAGRDSIFSAAYLGVTPWLREKLTERPYFQDRPTIVALLAATVPGALASVFSQPLDTVKTCMQANLNSAQHRSFMSTAGTLYGEAGLRGLYKGFIPRTQRVICAVFILAEAKSRLTSLYVKATYQNLCSPGGQAL